MFCLLSFASLAALIEPAELEFDGDNLKLGRSASNLTGCPPIAFKQSVSVLQSAPAGSLWTYSCLRRIMKKGQCDQRKVTLKNFGRKCRANGPPHSWSSCSLTSNTIL